MAGIGDYEGKGKFSMKNPILKGVRHGAPMQSNYKDSMAKGRLHPHHEHHAKPDDGEGVLPAPDPRKEDQPPTWGGEMKPSPVPHPATPPLAPHKHPHEETLWRVDGERDIISKVEKRKPKYWDKKLNKLVEKRKEKKSEGKSTEKVQKKINKRMKKGAEGKLLHQKIKKVGEKIKDIL